MNEKGKKSIRTDLDLCGIYEFLGDGGTEVDARTAHLPSGSVKFRYVSLCSVMFGYVSVCFTKFKHSVRLSHLHGPQNLSMNDGS
jgi:hypothetical protein